VAATGASFWHPSTPDFRIFLQSCNVLSIFYLSDKISNFMFGAECLPKQCSDLAQLRLFF
jgi:hypothetical protein